MLKSRLVSILGEPLHVFRLQLESLTPGVFLFVLEAERQAAKRVRAAHVSASKLAVCSASSIDRDDVSTVSETKPVSLNVDFSRRGRRHQLTRPGKKTRAFPSCVTASWRPCLSLTTWTGFSPAASHINDYFL